jgi:hypothetical protein
MAPAQSYACSESVINWSSNAFSCGRWLPRTAPAFMSQPKLAPAGSTALPSNRSGHLIRVEVNYGPYGGPWP